MHNVIILCKHWLFLCSDVTLENWKNGSLMHKVKHLTNEGSLAGTKLNCFILILNEPFNNTEGLCILSMQQPQGTEDICHGELT